MVRPKVWTPGWESHSGSLWNDARYGFRQMLRSPGLSLVAILSLALGIGANTAIFTVIDDLLLKRLPVQEPQMLVSLGDAGGSGIIAPSSPGPYNIFPYDFYRSISGNRNELDGICAFASFPTMVSVRTGPAARARQHKRSVIWFRERFLGSSECSLSWGASSLQTILRPKEATRLLSLVTATGTKTYLRIPASWEVQSQLTAHRSWLSE